MARLRNLLNPWGKVAGFDPQRTDLWQIDLSAVVAGLRDSLKTVNAIDQEVLDVSTYFARSVAIPQQQVKAEVVRRDSRAYQMPSWDDPLDAVRIVFMLDDGTSTTRNENAIAQSRVYKFLDMWRRVVRAGRGSVGAEESIRLNADYRIDYAFSINVFLLRGYGLPPSAFTQSTRLRPGESPAAGYVSVSLGGDARVMIPEAAYNEIGISQAQRTEVMADAGQLFSGQMEQGLYVSTSYVLENAWLSGFKLAELGSGTADTATIEANLFCDNVLNHTTDPISETL